VQRYGVRDHKTVLKQSTRPILPVEEVAEYNAATKLHKAKMKKLTRTMKEIEHLVKKDFVDVEH